MNTLTRFLGDTPLRVLVRLLFLSFLVGVVMAALGLEPMDLVRRFVDFVDYVWQTGFRTFDRAFQYLILGACVVIPIFIVMRLLRAGRG